MAERPRSGGILVVDDDSRLRESVVLLLRDAGYVAKGAANGREALEIAEYESPSLILLDLMMPVMDGWQFLAERETHRAARDAAVVLLSGMAFIRDAPGVAGFLTKPIRTESLLDYAQRFCPARQDAVS
ncbi:MAG TPA: response regulator [Thermoanaerobaculia bacterium]|nr:response regulator [Thermoanaerobaculia bacterium]